MLPVSTERLRLRRLDFRDGARLAEYRSDPSVAIYQSWSSMTVAEAHAFISEQSRIAIGQYDEWFQLAVADRASDDLIGDIGICIRSPGDVAEIGFSLAPEAQGQGYATEACRAAIHFVFSLRTVEVIEAVIDARNDAAIRLVKRLGMEFVRTEQSDFKGQVCLEHHFACERGSGRAA